MKTARGVTDLAATLQMTLRPARTLYALYVGKAAERSKEEGRNVSVQEIMLV